MWIQIRLRIINIRVWRTARQLRLWSGSKRSANTPVEEGEVAYTTALRLKNIDVVELSEVDV